MKNIIITLIALLYLPAAVNAQYLGGSGKGGVSSGVSDNFMGNFFKTDGNWSDASKWSDGALPGSSAAANIAAAAVVDGDYSYPSMTIASVGSVTISSGKSLSVTGADALVNNNDFWGLWVESGASLIQNSANVPATVDRVINAWGNPTINHGWHFLSSPVAAQEIDPAFTEIPSTNYDFFAWWEATNVWVNYKYQSGVAPTWLDANASSLNFIPGKGYLVEYAAADTKSFTGTLNKDNISVSNLAISSGINRGWHLLGNPFTSALAWNNGNWALSNIAATAKIWKESTAAYVDIAAGTGIIPALNGFMVQVATGTGSLTIPAAARVHNTTAWYKSSENPSILLMANDLSGQTAQESIIRFTNEATTGFDPAFDSHFLAGYAPQFYSVAGNEMLSTNALPEAGGSVQVPFDFIKNEGDNFTIEAKTITEIKGPVFLKDLKTGASQDMTLNPVYSFTSAEGDNQNRFLLRFSNVGIGETRAGNPITVFSSNNEIFVVGKTGIDKGNVFVYNMMGQLMAQQGLSGGGRTKISMDVSPGYYLVKVITGENTYSEKVFIN